MKCLSMKGLILAAGYGRRMRPLTDHTHKTLLEVGGQTIIGRIMDCLIEHGIEQTVVVTGYRAEELEGWLRRNYPGYAFQFVHNGRYNETNNIHSLALAFEHTALDQDILLIESDLVFESAVLSRLLRSPQENVALLDHYQTGMDGTVVSLRDGVITHVIPPHLQQQDFSFADKYKTLNIYKLSRDFCATRLKDLLTFYSRFIDDNCYYELMLGILIYMRQARIHGEVLEGERWAEVDDPNDLRAAEFVFNLPARRQILESTMGGYWQLKVLDFAFIRNMYFPTPAVLAEMRNSLPSLLRNYGSTQRVLNEKLSTLLLCRKDRLQVLNGASQIYPVLARLWENRKALIPQPTFGEYPVTFPNHRTYQDRGAVNPAELDPADCGVVVFVNPNNPTGTVTDRQTMYEYARRHPQVIVLVDESFAAFSPGGTVIELLEHDPLPNILIVTSLSKVLGMPGLRLGYVYSCDEQLIESIEASIPIWNLNSVAEFAMEILLKHRDSLRDSIARTIADREEFSRRLAELPIVESVYPSGGDFLLVRLNSSAADAASLASDLLREHSIYVREISSRFDDGAGWLRLAVRLPEENQRLCSLLKRR
jgi:histidinol-phosphate/aromatic aminotransferase/cobyric acid decarboxylase-like protein/choline kinase